MICFQTKHESNIVKLSHDSDPLGAQTPRVSPGQGPEVPWGEVDRQDHTSLAWPIPKIAIDFLHADSHFPQVCQAGRRKPAAEPDVVVRVRRPIVQVRVEHARIGSIVPVATAKNGARGAPLNHMPRDLSLNSTSTKRHMTSQPVLDSLASILLFPNL